tara:strand:- start:106 stop:579 length:474 start_codon:yes stop_codon:yes gene_type:complete
MIKIDVISDYGLWSKKIKRKKFFFNSIIKLFPKKYKFINKRMSLTVLLSNNKNIKKLNKKFRNKNKVTDVLSFPSEKNFKFKNSKYLGDIIISYEFMNKPKSINVINFKKRVIRIFIHSFLHLLGFDHKKFKDYKKMAAEEKKIYNLINLKKIEKLA